MKGIGLVLHSSEATGTRWRDLSIGRVLLEVQADIRKLATDGGEDSETLWHRFEDCVFGQRIEGYTECISRSKDATAALQKMSDQPTNRFVLVETNQVFHAELLDILATRQRLARRVLWSRELLACGGEGRT